MFRNFTFRRAIALILIFLLSLVAIWSIPSIVIVTREEILSEPVWVITVAKFRAILDLVLWVLITVELIDSIRVYLEERGLHIETVLSIALIAMARKIIVLDVHELSGVTIIGIAAVIIALCGGYFILRHCPPRTKEETERYESGGE